MNSVILFFGLMIVGLIALMWTFHFVDLSDEVMTNVLTLVTSITTYIVTNVMGAIKGEKNDG